MKKLLVLTIFIALIGIQGVYAQSQGEVNPFFNASSEDDKYVVANYDCTNLLWPPYTVPSPCDDPNNDKDDSLPSCKDNLGNDNSAIGVYRRVGKDSSDQFTVGTYYIYAGETIVDMEVGDVFTEDNRRLPDPILVKSKEDLEAANANIFKHLYPFEGRVICGREEIVPGAPEWGYKDPQDANLVPPTLQQLENYFLDIIYIVWSVVGLYFAGNIFYIGFKKMTEGFSPEQQGKVMTQLAYWIVGLIGFFIAVPALQYFYQILDINHTKCFYDTDQVAGGEEVVYDLTLPGFTFFFRDVCTGPYSDDS